MTLNGKFRCDFSMLFDVGRFSLFCWCAPVGLHLCMTMDALVFAFILTFVVFSFIVCVCFAYKLHEFLHLCYWPCAQTICIWGIWITFIIDSHLGAIKCSTIIAKLFPCARRFEPKKRTNPSNEIYFFVCVSKIQFYFICTNFCKFSVLFSLFFALFLSPLVFVTNN